MRPGPTGASRPADGKRRLIWGEGLVARISNYYEPQLPVVGEDIPGLAVTNYLGAVWPLETVDQRATVVGDGFRLPCSDSDESDDDVLSVGPMRPLVTAPPLGGARRDDDCRLQVDSLSDEWSVESWAAENRHEMCCARLDYFGRLPRPEGDEDLSDIEQDVCDVPDEFPVVMEMTAVEPLCFPVVVQTRPQVGCDPDLLLPVYKGQESLVEDHHKKNQMSVVTSVWYRISFQLLCLSWLRCR